MRIDVDASGDISQKLQGLAKAYPKIGIRAAGVAGARIPARS